MVRASRTDWLRHRFVVHDLHRSPGELSGVDDLALLDAGVQETGPDGARWAMATRGLELSPEQFARDCFLAWTLRGAPHAYRRSDRAAVTVATSPFSEADASKRAAASEPECEYRAGRALGNRRSTGGDVSGTSSRPAWSTE